jgi:hypothetical protein
MNWRCLKMRYLNQPFTFSNWDPKSMQAHILWLELNLFEDIENYALETLLKAF